jgi:6-phosphogluconolactonase (cycloisomerase 2 family)
MPSDIHISAEGRFLYVSNRYYDGGKITVFRVSKDGSLTMSGLIDTEGNDPRGFALSDGLLYAGLLDRNLVQVFRLSSENGLAGDCISRFEIPAPSSFVITK